MLASLKRVVLFAAIALVVPFGLTGCGPTTGPSDAPSMEPESTDVEALKKQYSSGEGPVTGGAAAPAPEAGGAEAPK